jgi:predicted transcriptional regulator
VTNRLTAYAELANMLGTLPTLLREARRSRGLSLAAAATEMGVTSKTPQRVESGQGCHVDTAAVVLQWLDRRRQERSRVRA